MSEFLLLAFLFLTAGVLLVPIATRLGLGSVLGYLSAGIILSPILALLQVDVHAIQQFAEFGVVMMLFLVGLELEPKLLWAMRHRLLGLGGLQVVGTAVVIMGAALMLGLDWRVALATGLILAMSSTAIVLQTLNEKGLMKGDGGQASFSVLLFQDISVIPILALVPLLALPDLVAHGAANPSDADHGATLSIVAGLRGWQTALVTLAAVGVVVAAGMFLARPIFRFVARARLREIFVATALKFVIGIALLMTVVGLSPALGTFLAGVVLANSEYRHELQSDIDPFRGLLLGLFFMTVGASIDFRLLATEAVPILAMTLGVMAIKTLVLLLLARIFGVKGSQGWLFGLGLAQAGEFGFVLISFGLAHYVLPPAIAPRLTLIITLSMMLTPALFILYDKVVGPRFSRDTAREADAITEPARIIIAGNGRFGGTVNRMLLIAGHETVVLDHSSAQLEALRSFGIQGFYGDATRPDLLHAAGINEAKLLVVAIDDMEQTTAVVRHVHRAYPHVHIIARARNRRHVYELYAAGCRDIIREVFDSSVRAGRSAYEALGMSRTDAERLAESFVADDRRNIAELAALFDPDVPEHENEAYRTRARELIDRQVASLRGRAGISQEPPPTEWIPADLRSEPGAVESEG